MMEPVNRKFPEFRRSISVCVRKLLSVKRFKRCESKTLDVIFQTVIISPALTFDGRCDQLFAKVGDGSS